MSCIAGHPKATPPKRNDRARPKTSLTTRGSRSSRLRGQRNPRRRRLLRPRAQVAEKKTTSASAPMAAVTRAFDVGAVRSTSKSAASEPESASASSANIAKTLPSVSSPFASIGRVPPPRRRLTAPSISLTMTTLAYRAPSFITISGPRVMPSHSSVSDDLTCRKSTSSRSRTRRFATGCAPHAWSSSLAHAVTSGAARTASAASSKTRALVRFSETKLTSKTSNRSSSSAATPTTADHLKDHGCGGLRCSGSTSYLSVLKSRRLSTPRVGSTTSYNKIRVAEPS
mmetsp:Transcript_3002/g.11430  ORF Transcript_3002/g.11430 Transcript_3002/m.11430 type:complete len:285 (+) Transcript_3002:1884-2738(+)